MSVKITGNLKGLKQLTKNAEKLKQKGSASFTEIVNPDFISSNTDYSDIFDLFKHAGFEIETVEQIENIPEEDLDNFISENTRFESFVDLQKKAASEYMRKQLFSGLK
ncbi:TPA: hypothetical protein ACSE23_002909 [Acinetobacter baumannii]|uniref:hypothetical protein n=1 Tax=Acinetobacter calcoaceticus/baumannii complex TaxID=909768 RepID=UPI00192CBC3E|nr:MULTISPECIES: hypothetical protein [Acinetobacter calcoaceticus/baumannii complex]EKV3837667.1 hypothetical protein [Acinetobacter baumannii]EKV6049048.1 hypothetical protein [Acinetobacter baumannii]ELY3912039.1 hypothetical protein [Acinetobacter baumannii]MDP7959920.1 hypothetical protein [Acinetobacter baumannii]HAV4613930.1 hypothetical protein [Acinetobacter baumannii]